MPEWLTQVFRWFSVPVLALLVGVLLWRRLYKEFPLFFSYLFVTELVTIIRFLAKLASDDAYFQIYWISNIVGSVFGLMAVYEVFVRHLFVDFYKVRVYRLLFPAAALAITFLGILTGLVSHNSWIAFGIIDRSLVFIRVAFLVFFVGLMFMMGREWTRYELGIAFGFGALNASSFFRSALWLQSLYRSPAINNLPLFGWDAACVIWFISFGISGGSSSHKKENPPERNTSASGPLNPEVLNEARKWESALKDWLVPKKR